MEKTMSTKKFFLTAFTAAVFITASFSLIFATNKKDDNLLKCYDERMYLMPDSSGDTTGDGGIHIPPTGH